jgi:ubiquinone/menaquinone biosynthesis C-methylase UbiE
MTHWTEKTYIESPDVIGESLHRGVDRADDDVTNLLALLDEHGVEPKRALDVACGIGRHSIELAETGVAVDGVDVSPEYIETARERAVEAGVSDKTSFGVADMRELDTTDDEYDVILNWFAFGYFEDDVNEAIVEKFRERLAPNGALVMGVDNGHSLLGDFQETGASVKRDVIKVERREYSPETGRLEVVITKFRERGDGYEFLGEVPWDTRLYGPAAFRRLLERAGFSSVALYGGLDGAALGRESSPLVAVAEPLTNSPKRGAASIADPCTPDN